MQFQVFHTMITLNWTQFLCLLYKRSFSFTLDLSSKTVVMETVSCFSTMELALGVMFSGS